MCRYRIIRDPAGWLSVAKDTGLIKVKNAMDRESLFVKDNKYTVLIGAYDNGRWQSGPAAVYACLHWFKTNVALSHCDV